MTDTSQSCLSETEVKSSALRRVEHHLLDDPRKLASKSAVRLNSVDGLRALAMLMVLLFHCCTLSGGWRGASAINSVVSFGYVGVDLFLVLSGFCLYWPFASKGKAGELTLWQFAQKRCRRILPPYYAAVLIFWLVLLADTLTHSHAQMDATTPSHVVKSLFWHLLMLHNLRPQYVLSINGPFWSLGLEFSLYIMFPIMVELFRRFGPLWPTLGALAVCVAFRIVLQRETPPTVLTGEEQFVLWDSLGARMFEFVAGMCAAYWLGKCGMAKGPTRLQSILALAACVGGGVAAVRLTQSYGELSVASDPAWGLAFAGLLFLAIVPGRIRTLFSHPWLVRLGIISYSVYLVHQPYVKVALHLTHHLHIPSLIASFFLIAPSAILIGYGFHLLFERPFLHGSAKRKTSPESVAALVEGKDSAAAGAT